MEPFLVRALVAGLGLAVIAAPFGCYLVWRRMAFFGETIAHASLIGVALSLAFELDMTASLMVVAIVVTLVLVALGRQHVVPFDSLLNLLAHAALAIGVLAAVLVRGGSLDLMSYLFGDIFAVSWNDIAWLAGVGVAVLGMLWWLWQPLLLIAIDEELAAAEGVAHERHKAVVLLMLALVIAVAMKIVGILLTVAFLIMPATAARPLTDTPEKMVALAALVAVVGVTGGLGLSLALNAPGGASIVVVLAGIATLSVLRAALRRA